MAHEDQTPVGIRAVGKPHSQIAVHGCMLDLATAERWIRRLVDNLSRRSRARAAAQLILVDVVVFDIQAPSGRRRIAHGGVRAKCAAAGCARKCGQRQHAQSQAPARHAKSESISKTCVFSPIRVRSPTSQKARSSVPSDNARRRVALNKLIVSGEFGGPRDRCLRCGPDGAMRCASGTATVRVANSIMSACM